MIEAAITGGDERTIEAILRVAREVSGSAGAEIDGLAECGRETAKSAAAELEGAAPAAVQIDQEIAEPKSIFEDWNGQIELGATRSTGRSSYFGLYSAVGLEREHDVWRHKLQARAEVQSGRSITDTERYFLAWQPNRKFDDKLYAYGLAQFERDSTQSYATRWTGGAGVGYSLLDSDKGKLELEGGPAVRRSNPIASRPSSSVSGRGSVNMQMSVSPSLQLKQTSSVYLEKGDTSASAITSLDAKLIGPLKTRLSYDVRYENKAASGSSALDTLSRITFIYSL